MTAEKISRQYVNLSKIKSNPNNPRIIKDDAFKKLVQSLKDFPEMIEAREIVVNKDMTILGGNMRYRAAKEAGLTTIPVKIVDWSDEKQREFVIKDNVSGGDWDYDLLANEWDGEQLDAWGLDLPVMLNDVDITEDTPPPVEDDSPAVSEAGGGLHGKDLSKADVAVNIYAYLKAQQTGEVVNISCAIGDEMVDGLPYSEIVEIARKYIEGVGGFEKFAEWGLV